MDIPINADDIYQEKHCGDIVAVVLNPVTDVVTHVVVKEKDLPHTQRLVPVELIYGSTSQSVHLRCGVEDLRAQQPFIEVEYINNPVPRYRAMHDSYYLQPLVIQEGNDVVAIKDRSIPLDELSISRGARVIPSDNHHVGQVDEFLVDQANVHISHLILREGHLWGQTDVTIPVSEIDCFEEKNVYLKLDKERIGNLPAIPVQRKWA